MFPITVKMTVIGDTGVGNGPVCYNGEPYKGQNNSYCIGVLACKTQAKPNLAWLGLGLSILYGTRIENSTRIENE